MPSSLLSSIAWNRSLLSAHTERGGDYAQLQMPDAGSFGVFLKAAHHNLPEKMSLLSGMRGLLRL